MMRCLRKGKGDEQALAAECLALIAIQLGSEVESLLMSCVSVLTTVMTDNSTHTKARGACATALAMIILLCCYDLEASYL